MIENKWREKITYDLDGHFELIITQHYACQSQKKIMIGNAGTNVQDLDWWLHT